ncbi:GNAT family N-acetyltransferase [Cellulomonas marina]|uniref:Mycothiol synthase n=1 Tax=Cellulomonas marina TaxID=988821 RepID=A0A1I0W1Q0_9CELL|nr:GNAT family N-acetyltransferase [Cellulomonas marina]GIG27402.1 putative acetyltransferase, GNAT [Cellulomonas marina]SFA82474.1 mycothiol synthase [Cellulomonas marina]
MAGTTTSTTTTDPTTATTLAPIAERAAPPAALPVPDAALGLAWRPLARADAPALHGLVEAVEVADGAPARTAPEEVEEYFDGEWRDLDRDTLGGFDPDGVLRAFADVSTAPGDRTVVRAFLRGGVHPDVRGRGIGRAVLDWSVGRGRQLLAASGKELPGRIAAYVDDDAHATVALLRRSALAPVRYYTEMRRSLADPLPPVRQVPGVRLEPFSADRDEQTRLAHNEAFADHWGSEPRTAEQWSQGRSMFAPAWSVLAVDEATDEVVGYALSGRYEQDWPVAGYSSGYTELLGVRRAWRGRGVAVALLGAVMAAYRADGVEYAELGVDTANPSGAHGLYASLGYEAFHSSTMWSIEL